LAGRRYAAIPPPAHGTPDGAGRARDGIALLPRRAEQFRQQPVPGPVNAVATRGKIGEIGANIIRFQKSVIAPRQLVNLVPADR
jgi:hypothetical protein